MRDLQSQQPGGAGAGGQGSGGAGGGPKPKGKAKAKGKAKPQPFKGTCNRCGRQGHMSKDCKARHHVNGKQLGSLEETEAEQQEVEEEPPSDFGGLFNSF